LEGSERSIRFQALQEFQGSINESHYFSFSLGQLGHDELFFFTGKPGSVENCKPEDCRLADIDFD